MRQKLLFILHFPPPVHGAAMVGRYIKESSLITNSFNSRYLNLGTSRTIDEIGKGGFQKWWRYYVLIKKTFFELINFRPHLVYLTLSAKGGGFYKDALVALIAKSLGTKVVYHFHNKGINRVDQGRFEKWLCRKVFQDAEVILLSEYLYSDVQKYVPKNKIHLCPNGIPDIAKTPRPKVFNSGKPIEILFLSNLLDSKGIFILLEACLSLKKEKVFFHCTISGSEGDIRGEELKENLRNSGLEDIVTFVGQKFGSAKMEVFKQADIFILPTKDDCLPLVLLEAMQWELPIVSTFEGGIPDVIEDGKTGFLIQPNDPAALAAKLHLLISHGPLRGKMGKEGRLKYEREFTLQAFEIRLTRILEEIIV